VGRAHYITTCFKPKNLPPAPITVGDHTLVIDSIVDFGYLTIETDGRNLSVTFRTSDASGTGIKDAVSVDLKAGKS
jgi:hypothetical protein